MVAAGVFCFINPGQTFMTMAFVIGSVMVINGLIHALGFLLARGSFGIGDNNGWILIDAVLTLLLGILILCNQLTVDIAIPMIFGMWVLVSGLLRFEASTRINRQKKPANFKAAFVTGIVTIIVGLFGFINPLITYVFKSPSITSTLRPLRARDFARFIVINDFPLPGLNEVVTKTFSPFSLTRNSTFVRSTRKASFIILRLPSSTTIAFFIFSALRQNIHLDFSPITKGISPTNGKVSFSISRRPRTVVLRFSRMKITITGNAKPKKSAIRIIFDFTGVVGFNEPVGGVIIRVL